MDHDFDNHPHGVRVIYAGFPSFFCLESEGGHIETFRLLLHFLDRGVVGNVWTGAVPNASQGVPKCTWS